MFTSFMARPNHYWYFDPGLDFHINRVQFIVWSLFNRNSICKEKGGMFFWESCAWSDMIWVGRLITLQNKKAEQRKWTLAKMRLIQEIWYEMENFWNVLRKWHIFRNDEVLCVFSCLNCVWDLYLRSTRKSEMIIFMNFISNQYILSVLFSV